MAWLLSALVGALLLALGRRQARAEGDRDQAEERFRRAFEDSGVGMALVGIDDGRMLDVNDALCRLTGRSRHDLLAGRISDLLPPEDAAAALSAGRALERAKRRRWCRASSAWRARAASRCGCC